MKENALLAQLGIGDEYAEPYDDRILVRPIETERTTPGGLHIPDTARAPVAPRGLVLAVAPLFRPENLEPGTQTIQPGDRLIYDGAYAVPVEVNGERLVMISATAVEGILRLKEAP